MTVVVVFTSRRALANDDEYHAMAAQMERLVADQPGFLEMTSVRDPVTRVGVTVGYFADHESVQAWRSHSGHTEAQRRGREAFYDDYRVTVAEVVRDYRGPGL